LLLSGVFSTPESILIARIARKKPMIKLQLAFVATCAILMMLVCWSIGLAYTQKIIEEVDNVDKTTAGHLLSHKSGIRSFVTYRFYFPELDMTCILFSHSMENSTTDLHATSFNEVSALIFQA